jgi:hypothetical protein
MFKKTFLSLNGNEIVCGFTVNKEMAFLEEQK